MAWSYRKNARHRNPKKNVVRKAVCNKTKRKTKNEMAGWRVHGPEKDRCKQMERQSKESRGLETYCRGGQGPPRAVAPSGGGSCNLIFAMSVFSNFLLADTFQFQKITINPHILAHVNTVCLDDRYPKLNIYISELTLPSYEHIPVAYITMHSMI